MHIVLFIATLKYNHINSQHKSKCDDTTKLSQTNYKSDILAI